MSLHLVIVCEFGRPPLLLWEEAMNSWDMRPGKETRNGLDKKAYVATVVVIMLLVSPTARR